MPLAGKLGINCFRECVFCKVWFSSFHSYLNIVIKKLSVQLCKIKPLKSLPLYWSFIGEIPDTSVTNHHITYSYINMNGDILDPIWEFNWHLLRAWLNIGLWSGLHTFLVLTLRWWSDQVMTTALWLSCLNLNPVDHRTEFIIL